MTTRRLLGRISMVVVTLLAVGAFSAGVAGAQNNSDGQGAYVGGTTVVRAPTTVAPAAPSAEVLGTSAAKANSSSLAFTGGDVAGLVVIGAAALAVGGLLVTSRRRTLRAA